MKSSFVFIVFIFLFIFGGFAYPVYSVAQSPYMGGQVNLTKAPNGAVVREEVLKTGARILYLEPTTEKLADGVWCIGGYSLANTTVIEAKDGLIVYDTGDTKEEAEHIREAIVPRNATTGQPISCEHYDENYDENDSETMLNAITKLDSVKKEYNLEAITKETLINQLQKDCPKAVLVIEELTD